MSDIIQKMRESDSQLLKAEAEDLAKWSKLRHTKLDFELFLNFNIAEVQFMASDGKQHSMICSSNTTLLQLLKTAKEDAKKQIAGTASKGIRTKDKRSVDTFDLRELKQKTISLSSWQIVNFVSITPANILVLTEIVKKLLKC